MDRQGLLNTTLGKTAPAVFLAFTLSAAAPAVAQDGEVTLSVGQARAVARAALEAGDLQVADQITTGLLAMDGTDFDALMIRALTARAAGDLDAAETAATAAWRSADTEGQRFDAAFLSGEIASRQEKFERAKLWLRRADQNAPSEAAEVQVARAFSAVARRSPIAVQLTFTLRPSDNLNNGSDPENEDTSIGGLTGTTEEKVSGIELATSVSLVYRLSESEAQRTDIYANAYVRLAFPESDLEEKVPGATDREFDFISLATGVTQRRNIFEDLGQTTFRGGIGASYYRNEHFANFAELAVTQDVRLDDALLRFGGILKHEDRLDSPAASYTSQALSVDWFDRTEGGLQWSVGTTLTNYDSDAPTVNGTGVQLRARAELLEPIFGARPDLSVSLTWRDLPEFTFGVDEDGRQDISGRAALGLTFTEMSFYGFLPRIEGAVSVTDAEFDLYDRQSLSVGATLVSRF